MNAQSIREAFPLRLKFYMGLHRKTRNDIAKALKVSYSSVRDWEQGITIPRMDKIEHLAMLFGCTTADLLEEKKEPATDDGSELTKRKLDFIEKVRRMSAADLARFEETLRFVEKMK